MFPCQWKTIAPFLGRSAHMCIEHFQELLDKAENRQVDPNNDPRKLRPGEIDPNPESKPARPDPIDLDEDMKETLNEARARVANTRGKKAKRKIREKQLEEARKLATLQKKRELKAAGIEFHVSIAKRLLKETNYNRDVPFMREVPKGTWTDDNDNETPPPDKYKADINLQYLEGRSRDIQEEKQKKKDEAKMKSLKLKNLPKALEIINKKYNFLDEKKDKINLPKPKNDINEIEMKKEDEEESEDENENDEDEVENIKPNFDFLKMDIFNTNIGQSKKEKIIQDYLLERLSADHLEFDLNNYDIRMLCAVSNCGLTLTNSHFYMVIRQIILGMINNAGQGDRHNNVFRIIGAYAEHNVIRLFQREIGKEKDTCDR